MGTAAASTAEVRDIATTQAQEDTLAKLAEGLQGKGVHAKVAWVRNHVGTVDKTGKFSAGQTNYNFMQEHGLIGVLRPLWRIAGLDVQVAPDSADHFSTDEVPTRNGVAQRAVVVTKITVTDTEEPFGQVSGYYANEGVDNQDKAFGKAYTGATKYALQKFFLVPTDQIDDNDAVSPERVPAQQVAATVTEITSRKPKEEDVAKLRDALTDATNAGHVDLAWVKNTLTAEYGVKTVNDLTKPQFQDFSTKLTEKVAGPPLAQ